MALLKAHILARSRFFWRRTWLPAAPDDDVDFIAYRKQFILFCYVRHLASRRWR